MNRFLLDTHIWIWVQQRDTSKLSSAAFRTVEVWQREQRLFLSAISAWEIALLEQAGRIRLGMPPERFLDLATQDGGFQLLPVSPRILIESVRLPGDLHRDPADRILAATARESGLTLVTRDDRLLEYAAQGHLNARQL
ncbi:MAG TPA: type II toxin-antitoxin system VapC family toxin [Acidobacteriaceae bacterium]|nr:type II toxin-antitoxin system VapC family toxin [Acidobacteriaceae bacterium]